MYALALTLSTSIPFFRLGELDVGIPIQAFGVIVAIGVLIGAGVLRRYAEWHGISDDHIRGITGWVTVTGFIGAHVFDVIAYQWNDFMRDPILILQIWKGISSYGGFLGGAFGFFFYVWWKERDLKVHKQPYRLFADVVGLGLLVAFSIGRIACTVVSDHIGAAVDPNKWYAALAMPYPRHLFPQLSANYPGTSESILAWNLGFIELLYLIPVNIFLLWLGFRAAKPNGTTKDGKEKWIDKHPAGLITVLIGVLYTPVRFFMDFLRPEETDPRHLGLTFAQWISIVGFVAVVALAMRVLRTGKPAEPVTRTSGEAQRQLKLILKEDVREQDPKAVDKIKAEKAAAKVSSSSDASKKDPKLATALPEDDEDEELAKEALAARSDDSDAATTDDKKADAKADKPAATKPKPKQKKK